MSIETTFFPEFRLGYHAFSGELSIADLSRGYAEFLAAPGASAIHHTINDFRGLTAMRMFPEGLEQFGKIIVEDMARNRTSKNVVLFSPPRVHLSMAAEYARQITASGQGRCAVHFDFAKALDWLGLPHAIVDLVTRAGRRLIDPDPGWPVQTD